jgi:hypothetical protein
MPPRLAFPETLATQSGSADALLNKIAAVELCQPEAGELLFRLPQGM